LQRLQTNVITKACFLEIRKRTEDICQSLVPEDTVVQPVAFVSPPKWHLAHTTWFFEQFVLTEYLKDYQVFHKDYAFYFNSYYNNVGDRVIRSERGLMTRPVLQDIIDYRAHVNAAMARLFENDLDQKLYKVIEIGLQHEQQHQELLLYDIKYIYGHQPSFPTITAKLGLEEEANTEQFIRIQEGIYNVGFKGHGFCWDNELDQHRVFINEFEISNRLVTNEQYITFIESGGYQNFNHWHADGWDYIQENTIKAPLYWYKIDGKWKRYTLNSGLIDVEGHLPVSHVSMYEAYAYAQWRNLRLPTEFEWEVASSKISHGQLWEWTNSAYLPYPNFKKAEGALGEYNGKFMINQIVLRGGSIASPPNHVRPTYRNFFQPEMRWLFSGIRLAK
jgi:ergothioneine biosynthesis protein EgtB